MNTIAQARYRPDGKCECGFPYSAYLISNLKIYIPAHSREYAPETKIWIIDPDYASLAIQLMRGVYPDTILRDDRHKNSGWRFSRTEPVEDPSFEILYVLPNAPRCVIDAAYRALSKEIHPDRAPEGERSRAHEAMTRLNAAYQIVLRDRVGS